MRYGGFGPIYKVQYIFMAHDKPMQRQYETFFVLDVSNLRGKIFIIKNKYLMGYFFFKGECIWNYTSIGILYLFKNSTSLELKI